MSRRFISAKEVEGWERRLRSAVDSALSEQWAFVRRTASGLVAAGRVGALTGAAPIAWDQSHWAQLVDSEIAPVASDVINSAFSQAAGAVPQSATWGIGGPSFSPDQMTGAALGSGAAIGERLNGAALTEDPEKSTAAVIATSSVIVGGLVGSLALAAANSSTNDVATAASPTATKVWSAIEDDRTREDHSDADGQEVLVTDTFSVGGEDMMYPGDPSASDAETINCRCWMEVGGV